MLNGCGAHLRRCLQQGYALFLGFADEFTRVSRPHIHEYAPVRFALRLASGQIRSPFRVPEGLRYEKQ